MHTTVIVFTGLPGTGKTTLSRQVAEILSLPLIAKDDIKEIMYDTIGHSDVAFSAKLAHATFAIMDHLTEQHLKNGQPLLLESNYMPRLANGKFQNWQKKYNCTIVQVVCQTDTDILAQRYFDRQETSRHPGHAKSDTAAAIAEDFRMRISEGDDQPLGVMGPVQIIDTTDFGTVDAQKIAEWIREQFRTAAAAGLEDSAPRRSV